MAASVVFSCINLVSPIASWNEIEKQTQIGTSCKHRASEMHVIKLETLSALNRPGFKNRFSRANFVNLGRTHPKFPFENLNIGRQQISNFCIKHNHLLLHKMSELMHILAKEAIPNWICELYCFLWLLWMAPLFGGIFHPVVDQMSVREQLKGIWRGTHWKLQFLQRRNGLNAFQQQFQNWFGHAPCVLVVFYTINLKGKFLKQKQGKLTRVLNFKDVKERLFDNPADSALTTCRFDLIPLSKLLCKSMIKSFTFEKTTKNQLGGRVFPKTWQGAPCWCSKS